MGLYTIAIVGDGSIGNGDPGDADVEMKEIVSILKKYGHRIYDATLVEIKDEGTRINLEDE